MSFLVYLSVFIRRDLIRPSTLRVLPGSTSLQVASSALMASILMSIHPAHMLCVHDVCLSYGWMGVIETRHLSPSRDLWGGVQPSSVASAGLVEWRRRPTLTRATWQATQDTAPVADASPVVWPERSTGASGARWAVTGGSRPGDMHALRPDRPVNSSHAVIESNENSYALQWSQSPGGRARVLEGCNTTDEYMP